MDLKLNQTYRTEVIKILQYGCIVKLSDGSTSLVHVSQISPQYVNNISDFVSVGDVLYAQYVPSNKGDSAGQLSFKHLNLSSQPVSRNVHNVSTTRVNTAHSSGRKQTDNYYSTDDDVVPLRSRPSKVQKRVEHDSWDTFSYDNYRNKQKRADRRNNKRRRKDKYFD